MMVVSSPFTLQTGDKFAFLLLDNVYVDFPAGLPTQLKDGTWILDKYPASPDLHWEKMVGEIRFREIQEANLVVARIRRDQQYVLTQADEDAGQEAAGVYSFLQLSGVVEHHAANLVLGSVDDKTYIRQLSIIEKFYATRGYVRNPITVKRLEHANDLASVVRSLNVAPDRFGRFRRGLNCLMNGLREIPGQERLHQFSRALEALILPDTGSTKKQFVHRCQLFAVASPAAATALEQSYDMRSDAEHIHDWDRSLRNVKGEQIEDVALWRTRQMEALACFAYDRILTNPGLLQHFENDATLANFWKGGSDKDRIKLLGWSFRPFDHPHSS